MPAALSWLCRTQAGPPFFEFHLGDPDPPFHTKFLLQEACLGGGPGANSLKVFSSSSQRRTSTTKRLWKALTEALSCGCDVEESVFGGRGGEDREVPTPRPGSPQAVAASPEKVLCTP